MTIGERIIETFGGVTAVQMEAIQQDYETRINRAYEAGYSDGNDEPPQGDLNTFSYRVLGDAGGERDFSKIDRARVLEEVWSLWQSSPIAKRIMALKRDHLIGRNAEPVSNDDDLQAIFTDAWKRNKLDRRIKEFCLQLFLLGEQCYPVFVRKSDGRVNLGYIDPAQIERVITHPENAMENWAVGLKPQTAAVTKDTWVETSDKHRVYRIVREDEGIVMNGAVITSNYEGKLVTAEQATLEEWEAKMLKAHGLSEYTGSCFYEKVNSVSNHPRGYSDLMQVGDWIEEAERTLLGIADREQIAAYYFTHAQVDGDDEAVKKWTTHFRSNPPKRWGVSVTNKSVDIEVKQPDLKQAASISSFVALLTLIMGGVGYPLSWYGYGNDTNRATLDKQADPTEKSLEHDQDLFKDFMLLVLRFTADQAEIAGKGKFEDADIDLTLGEINPQNLVEIAGIFGPLVQAVIAARDNDLTSNLTAAEVVARVLGEMGIKVEAKEEMETAEQETNDKEEEDTERRNGQLLDRMKVGMNGNNDERAK